MLMRRSLSGTLPHWSRSVARSSRKRISARMSVPGTPHPNLRVTPDGRSLLTASEDGELARWDLRSRKKTRTWKIETGTAPALAVSPDGFTAAVGITHGMQLVDLRSGAMRTATGDLAGSPNRVLFSPDGKMVVSTSRDTTVTRWDVESAAPLETLRGHSSFVQQPVFSPDGETLYTVSHDGTAIAWDLTGDRRLGRPFTFTHDRSVLQDRLRRPPGETQPRRAADRRRAQGAGRRALGRAPAQAGRARRSSIRAARSRRSPSHRTGERLRR